jgi:hypothetical protein
MNLRLSPKRDRAAMGNAFSFVRSWKAVFIAFRK